MNSYSFFRSEVALLLFLLFTLRRMVTIVLMIHIPKMGGRVSIERSGRVVMASLYLSTARQLHPHKARRRSVLGVFVGDFGREVSVSSPLSSGAPHLLRLHSGGRWRLTIQYSLRSEWLLRLRLRTTGRVEMVPRKALTQYALGL